VSGRGATSVACGGSHRTRIGGRFDARRNATDLVGSLRGCRCAFKAALADAITRHGVVAYAPEGRLVEAFEETD
jgi:hypothetical protein